MFPRLCTKTVKSRETKFPRQHHMLTHHLTNHACKMIYKYSAIRWIYFNIIKNNKNQANQLSGKIFETYYDCLVFFSSIPGSKNRSFNDHDTFD